MRIALPSRMQALDSHVNHQLVGRLVGRGCEHNTAKDKMYKLVDKILYACVLGASFKALHEQGCTRWTRDRERGQSTSVGNSPHTATWATGPFPCSAVSDFVAITTESESTTHEGCCRMNSDLAAVVSLSESMCLFRE